MGLRRDSRGAPERLLPTAERLRKKWPWAAPLNPEGRAFPGEKFAEFEAAARACMLEIEAKEPGTLFYCIGRHRQKEGLYYSVEIYKDRRAHGPAAWLRMGRPLEGSWHGCAWHRTRLVAWLRMGLP